MTKKRGAETELEELVSPGEIRDAISLLDEALFNHGQWMDAINTTLICRLHPDERDLSGNAHRNCRLGQWYYSDEARRIRGNRNFAELEDAHWRMHQRAAHLLALSASGRQILASDYELFMHELKRMRLQIETLKRELEDAIYNIDALTGASSRVGMLTMLREQQELVKRKLETCVVVMMDIDRFKSVNDTYGHSTGDRALAAFAHHVMRHTRPFDRLFRYGGEEFLLCVPHTDLDTAQHLVERIRAGLADVDITCRDGDPIHISASFGVAMLDPDLPVAESVDRADSAVYAAKMAGRNRAVVWDPSMGVKKAS